MSIQAVAWALDQDIPNSGLKLVLIALCNHADKDSWMCYPPRSRIEREASMSRSTAKRHIKRLAELGIVEFSASYDGSGRQRANTYRVVTDPEEQKRIAASQSPAPTDGEGVKLNPSQSVESDVENTGKTGGEGVNTEPGEGAASGPPEGSASDPPMYKPSEQPSEKPCSDLPPKDARGNFIITPDRPEWEHWLTSMPEPARNAYRRIGRIGTPRQWPKDSPPSNPDTEK